MTRDRLLCWIRGQLCWVRGQLHWIIPNLASQCGCGCLGIALCTWCAALASTAVKNQDVHLQAVYCNKQHMIQFSLWSQQTLLYSPIHDCHSSWPHNHNAVIVKLRLQFVASDHVLFVEWHFVYQLTVATLCTVHVVWHALWTVWIATCTWYCLWCWCTGVSIVVVFILLLWGRGNHNSWIIHVGIPLTYAYW